MKHTEKINKIIILIFLFLIFAHIMLGLNKTYSISDKTPMSEEQYELYILHNFNPNNEIINTHVSYFNFLPDWTINIVYCMYFLCIVVFILWGKIDKEKLKLSTTYKAAILGIAGVFILISSVSMYRVQKQNKRLEHDIVFCKGYIQYCESEVTDIQRDASDMQTDVENIQNDLDDIKDHKN